MAIFYAPDTSTRILPEEESLHAIKVLRLKSGDNIQIVDGAGGYFNAKITISHHKHCGYEILNVLPNQQIRDYYLHIAIAPTKNIERYEWFIEKATEIGVDEITPLICQNSERRILKEDRLAKVIVAAAKQSLKSHFPVLNPITEFNQFVSKISANQKFIAHCHNSEKQLLKQVVEPKSSSVILIGPEGDFSLTELNNALINNFIPVSLGESRLRTETAGVFACSLHAFIN